MSVPVVTSPEAKLEAVEIGVWYADHVSADYGMRWFDAFDAAVAGLTNWPRSYGYAREHGTAQFPGPGELREAPVGVGRKPSHRVVFRVRLDRGAAVSVEVLTVRAAG